MSGQPVRILELRSVRGTGGGPEKTILLGASRADAARFAVTVCYLRDARDQVFDIARRAAPLDVDYVELVERHSLDRRVWPILRRIVRDRAIDIIHSHDYKTNLLGWGVAKAEGAVPLATAHGWTGRSLREQFLYYPADKRLLRAFPLTIAVSNQIQRELIDHGVRCDRVQTILNGIDHNAFRRDRTREARVRHALGLASDDIVVGSVGRLEHQKRFDLLIRACAAVRKRRPALRLLIAGNGSLHGSLCKLAASLLPPDSFRLLGHVDGVETLHHAFSLFVQSSDYEGTPNAVLEAMALESPIVATAAGGTAEIVRDGTSALLVRPGDLDALTAAIDNALADREAATARAACARREVETRLSFDARMTAIENIYSELAARRRRRGSNAA